MDRRNFIKLTAVTGTSAALASCGNPEHQIIRFVPDEDITPGIAEWKPSVCPLCAGGCGLTVRVMDADYDVVRNGEAGVVKILAAKKLEGQPDHPINRGRLCPRGQAAIQITYHPDRLTQPMKRSGARGSGEFKPIAWDQAIAELVGQLDQLAAAGDQSAVAWLTRSRRSRRLDLAAEFLRSYGAKPPLVFDTFSDDVVRRANAISFGHEQLPTVDLARSRFVLSFGADVLGTWNSPVAQNAGYGEMRQGHPQIRGTFVQVEPRMSQTGANADEWVPARPGTEGVLALAMARVISGSGDYTPDDAEKITGVAAKRIERLAKAFADAKPAAVAIAGGAAVAHTNGLATAVAVNALNTLVGSVEQPGGIFFPPTSTTHDVRRFTADEVRSTKVLLIDGANPIHGSPRALNVRDAIAKVPFIVSFGNFVDDTSGLADLILPDHSFLESWTDSAPESGATVAVVNVAGPVMRPLHDTRATPDVLIDVAGKLKKPVALPWKSFDEMLKASLGDEAFATAQKQGWVTPTQRPAANSQRPATSNQRPANAPWQPPAFDGDAAQYPFHLLPYPSQTLDDGSVAHLPWLQELPDPVSSAMWSSWVELNPATAAKLNVSDGDLVDVTSTHGTLRVPAVLSPGIAPDVVAIPAGQGHETFTRYASKRGVNPIGILAPSTVADTGALAWAATRVKLARAADGDGSLILFAGELRERPHEHETR